MVARRERDALLACLALLASLALACAVSFPSPTGVYGGRFYYGAGTSDVCVLSTLTCFFPHSLLDVAASGANTFTIAYEMHAASTEYDFITRFAGEDTVRDKQTLSGGAVTGNFHRLTVPAELISHALTFQIIARQDGAESPSAISPPVQAAEINRFLSVSESAECDANPSPELVRVWHNPKCWSAQRVPTASDVAYILDTSVLVSRAVPAVAGILFGGNATIASPAMGLFNLTAGSVSDDCYYTMCTDGAARSSLTLASSAHESTLSIGNPSTSSADWAAAAGVVVSAPPFPLSGTLQSDPAQSAMPAFTKREDWTVAVMGSFRLIALTNEVGLSPFFSQRCCVLAQRCCVLAQRGCVLAQPGAAARSIASLPSRTRPPFPLFSLHLFAPLLSLPLFTVRGRCHGRWVDRPGLSDGLRAALPFAFHLRLSVLSAPLRREPRAYSCKDRFLSRRLRQGLVRLPHPGWRPRCCCCEGD